MDNEQRRYYLASLYTGKIYQTQADITIMERQNFSFPYHEDKE